MNNKIFYLAALFVLTSIFTVIFQQSKPIPDAASAATSGLTGYYNLMGYEDVATIGEYLDNFGPAPPVGDYVTTHCRYIDVSPLYLREYYLRYFLHLPNGATLTQIDAYIADFAEIGSIGVELRSRPWNSRDPGTVLGSASAGAGIQGDTTP